MVKTISLPEVINEDLESISRELTSIAKKPISPAMAVSLLIAVYRAHMSNPCTRDAFVQKIATSDFLSPEEFERDWDVPSQKGKGK